MIRDLYRDKKADEGPLQHPFACTNPIGLVKVSLKSISIPFLRFSLPEFSSEITTDFSNCSIRMGESDPEMQDVTGIHIIKPSISFATK